MYRRIAPPGATGLYDPANEHDGCGIALVAKLWGEASHAVVEKALDALENLEHRGAEGADPNTGDGAGILLQIPDGFLRAAVAGVELPSPGRYGVGVCYLPQDPERQVVLEQLIEDTIEAEGQRAIWWRDVPIDERHVGETARLSAPVIRQVLIAASDKITDQDAFERKLYVIRRVIERAAGRDLALPSFSSRTMIYKGMLTAPQLPRYFTDLRDPRVASRLALVHSRFSTNTFPSWELAHPYRMIAHNGEVNTLRGNVNWMRARESQLASELFGDDLEKVIPVVREGGSDSAIFDNVLELLVLSGRSIPHAVMMMVPEAYRTRRDLDPDVKGFYDFHSCLIEPWDGPAAVVFTDGRIAGAVLDRNGLRPGRWIQDTEGYVVLASETGVMTVAPEHVQRKGRLSPGKVFLVDLEEGKIIEDEEVKRRVARRQPYGEWYERSVVHIDHLPDRDPRTPRIEPLRSKQLAFGYSQEDLRMIIAPMATKAEEPVASMGNDAALAVMSDRQPPLFAYFKQLFAQVTNPPIDPIRENVVMSLQAGVGAEVNLLAESPEHAHQLVMDQPILRNHELEKLRQVSHEIFYAATLDITWPIEQGYEGMERRLEALCKEAARYVDNGANILILSDRNLGAERVATPSLLAVAAVHHHLVRRGTRLRTGLVIESGEPRDIHHMATLDRLRRCGDQPVRDVRVARRARRPLAPPRGPRAGGGREADRQGDRQGTHEDHLEDGDLDDPVLWRGADLRGGRARAGADRQALHGHGVADRRGRARAARPGGDRATLPRLPAHRPRGAAGRRRVAVAAERRAARLESGHDRQPPARRPGARTATRVRPTRSTRGWPTRTRFAAGCSAG